MGSATTLQSAVLVATGKGDKLPHTVRTTVRTIMYRLEMGMGD